MPLIPTAAVAAVAVAGGVVTHQPEDTGGGPRILSAEASAQALELAAAMYEKSTHVVQGEPRTSEQWDRWDGTGSATLPGVPPAGDGKGFDKNKIQIWYGPNQEEKWEEEGYDDRSQRQSYRFLGTLPSDPGAMMRRVREEHAIGDVRGETRAERDWRELDVLYRSVLIPPRVQAMFRAMADIPGAHVEKDVKDRLGRQAPATDRRRKTAPDLFPGGCAQAFPGRGPPSLCAPDDSSSVGFCAAPGQGLRKTPP